MFNSNSSTTSSHGKQITPSLYIMENKDERDWKIINLYGRDIGMFGCAWLNVV